MDTPIAEETIVGMAVGAAMEGFRPVAEFQYADFMSSGFDEITTVLARYHYRSRRAAAGRAPRARAAAACARRRSTPRTPSRCSSHPAGSSDLPRVPDRRQGPAQVGDSRRQPVRVPRAQVDLPADQGAGAGGSRLPGPDRDGRRQARRRRRHDRHVRRDGAQGARGRGVPRRPGISAEVVDLRTVYPLDEETVLRLDREDVARAGAVRVAPVPRDRRARSPRSSPRRRSSTSTRR